jgi:hypothetical protein
MSLARKCDICGKYYENYGKSSMGNLFNEPNSIKLIFEGYGSTSEMTINRYDCCPECMAEITKVINNLKAGNPDHSRELHAL